ncbi:MAG: hypothetical protein Q8Q09_13850 [Deltaproteobacteria bacterium]|nr:hypothetical protein [Deltaproteobacteria bacterium]
MTVEIQTIRPGESIKDFLNVAFEVYRNEPNYVFPIDLEDRLNPKKNPFFLHADAAYFVARRGGKLVGRVTAQIDHEHQTRYNDKVGFFGFLDTIDDEEVVRVLLETASAWLKERGMTSMRGPMSLSINEEMGNLIEGFDTPPSLMMPHHWPYQGGLIEKAGLTKIKDVFAWNYLVGEVPARARRAHTEMLKDPALKIRTIDLSNAERDMRIVMEIFNETWADNWGFVPMTEPELKKTVEDFKLILRPEIALIVEINGEPAAIAIAVPNVHEAIHDLKGSLFPTGFIKLLWRLKVSGTKSARLMLLGVRKKIREQKKYMPLSVALYTEMNDRGQKLGMTHGELSWTLEDNAPVNVAIKAMGAKIYKTYRVYERPIEQASSAS